MNRELKEQLEGKMDIIRRLRHDEAMQWLSTISLDDLEELLERTANKSTDCRQFGTAMFYFGMLCKKEEVKQ